MSDLFWVKWEILKKNNKINKNDADFGHSDKRRKIFYEPALM